MPKSPLQRAEWKILGMAISDAKVRAARGELMAGYTCLVAGLRRMEEFVTGGEAWAGALLDAYRREAHTFRETHPVADPPEPEESAAAAPDEAPEAVPAQTRLPSRRD